MKSVIVTGASGNLGQAIVKKFLSGGYRVIGTVVPNDTAIMDTQSPNFEKAVVDLTNEDEAEKFVGMVVEKTGTIDVAVLTVGGFAMGSIADTRHAELLKQYKLNFETTYHVARPVFMQMMKQNKGRIFLTGARTGLDMKNSKGMVAYGLAKSLIFRLAELMNGEAKGHDVVTSVITPSTIDTPQNRKAMPGADFARWVLPESIADIVFFYSSDHANVLRQPVLKVYGNA